MKPPETIVGLWDGHDAGAALVVEGRVVLAVNEERLSGRKLEVGWPAKSLAQVREAAGNRWDEAHFAITTSDPAKTLTRLLPGAKERYYQLRRRLTEPRWSDGLTRSLKYRLTQWPTCPPLVAWTRWHTARTLGVSPGRVSVVDHHEAHAATAAYWTAWETDALIVTLDGIGDGLSGSVWRLSSPDGGLAPLLRLPGAASLGLFFEHVTEALQMRALEDEGKVMALASFSAELPVAKNPFAAWFRLEPRSTGELPRLVCTIPPQRMRREVERVVWRLPREQVCRAAQSVLEQIVPTFFAALSEATGVRSFGYAGGVASNIKVNRLVRLLPGVERLAICPAMGDGGLALGAAWATWRRLVGRRPLACPDFRLGLDRGDLGEGVEKLLQPGETLVRPRDTAEDAATLVSAGEVIMWAQGRMELGARALGARSIVARADSEKARDALNLRLKRRVWFQPFCPTLLDSEAPRLLADFRGKNDVNRHMTMGFQTTPAGKAALAGAIGPDASCRPQMVEDDSPDPWARLLHAVKARTGVGAVINTSLNLHGKPMPDTAADILAAWRESGVRHLVLGRARLSREDKA
jgi:carbamoyltransferase